ncbi:hypothetical protein PPS11_43718 [Pseudomonas putida S11]|nr:hypothetical protein PPS11_43718 [Pseudomonas putida S11]
MNAPLRVNEALLIADHAFEPFQCVAWDAPNGTGELSLAVIDRTSTRIGSKQVSSRIYSDPAQWASLIEEVRAELCEKRLRPATVVNAEIISAGKPSACVATHLYNFRVAVLATFLIAA